MEYVKLGSTGLDVSPICLGCMSYGEPGRGAHPWSLDEDASRPFFRQAIEAGNQLIGKPYVYGGGHASFVDRAYDCSGSVSYALAAGGLLSAPLVSGDLAGWGEPGPGRWITIYANAGHAFMYVGGIDEAVEQGKRLAAEGK